MRLLRRDKANGRVMFESFLRHTKLLAGPMPATQARLEGTLKGSTTAIRAMYTGSGATLPFLADVLFSSYDQQFSSRTSGLDHIEERGWDLILIERPPLWSAFDVAPADIRIPAWISQSIDLSAIASNQNSPLHRKRRRDLERIMRRSSYTIDLSVSIADMRRFFHEMYRPYVQARFARQAILVSEEAFLSRARTRQLARLWSHGQWIAGMLLERTAGALRFGWFGACHAPPPPGASEALDALIMQWAAGQGIRRVVLGHSRPSLIDGTLRYKRRIGAQISATRFPQPQIAIRITRCNDALVNRLDAASLIRIRGGQVLVHRANPRTKESGFQLEPIDDARS